MMLISCIVVFADKHAMTHLSEKKSIAIIASRRAGISIRRTASLHGVTPRTVTKIMKKYNIHGTTLKVKSTGRPRIFSEAAENRLLELMLNNDFTAKAAGRELQKEGIIQKQHSLACMIAAARRAAARKGTKLVYKRGRPKKGLTQKNMDKRVAFAERHLQRDWSKTLFTDRVKIPFEYPGIKVPIGKWLRAGDRWEASKVNHASCINFYAGVSPYGVTKIHCVTGTTGLPAHDPPYMTKGKSKKAGPQLAKNITAMEYRDVLIQTLLPEGLRLFKRGSPLSRGSFCFMQDGDRAHFKAQDHIDYFNSRLERPRVKLLEEWPANSPDMNIIENIWHWVRAQADAKGCTSFTDWCKVIDTKLKNVPKEMIENLYGSMSSRLQKVIDRNGKMSGY